MTDCPAHPAASPRDPEAKSVPAAAGLTDLAHHELSEANARRLADCCAGALGPAGWQRRKREELHGLLALEERAERLVVRQVDLRTDLQVIVELRDTPVPVRPPDGRVVGLVRGALLAIRYPEALLVGPVPGTLPVRILAPRAVFHSNVAYGGPAPPLCIGASVPRGTPLREIVLISYGALTLQTVSLDQLDPAGVLNAAAAAFYQAHADQLPLTRAPFLAPITPVEGEAPPPPASGAAEEAGS